MNTRLERLLVLKNAIANLVRGGASAIVALGVPPFLTRCMSTEAFGAWSLILQLSAYVSYLDFGIQTAVSRFVAHATERKDAVYRDHIVNTALACLTASGAIGFMALVLLAAALPHLFHRLPLSLLFDVRVSLLLVGGALCAGLPISVFAGIFVGLQRNEIPAIIIGGSRLTNAALLILIARNGGGLIAMATATAITYLASYICQFLLYKRVTASLSPSMELNVMTISGSAIRELTDYCMSLAVWSFGLVLVTGLDLTIVGFYRFFEIGYYAVAATLVTFLAGAFGAAFGALGSPAAVLHARQDDIGLAHMVSTTTRLGMVFLLATGLPIIFGARFILRLWVGATYSDHCATLVQLLVAANMVRLCVSPYIIAMIGAGEQRRIILVPLLEGVVNLLVSLWAGYFMGAKGVALGTLIGSFVSLGGHLAYTIHRKTGVNLSAKDYFRQSILPPIVCVTPIIALKLLWKTLGRFLSHQEIAAISVFVAGLCLILVCYLGMTSNERQRIARKMKSAMHSANGRLVKAK